MRTIELCEPVEIEALLVWTYRHQRADMVIDRGMGMFDQEQASDGKLEPHGTSADGVIAIARIGELGCRVGGGGASSDALHIDAEIVHEAVMCLPRDARELVIVHARAASRPDDDAMPVPRPFPIRAANGRVAKEYAPWDKSRNYGWTPIGWTVTPRTLAAVRAEYAQWRQALAALAFALATDCRMTRHRAIHPSSLPIAASLGA